MNKYFKISDAKNFAFYKVPKALFEEKYKSVSTDAKMLYGLLLDRMYLSVKNGWIDKQGRSYQYFTIKSVQEKLDDKYVRVELDDRSEKLGYRMREGQVEKVPYLLVVGFNEKDDRTVSFRLHGEKETTVLPLDTFVEKIKAEIAEKSREHIHVN